MAGSIPKILQLPSPDAMPSMTLVDGIVAFAVNAESDADALAMCKAQNGNDPDSLWDSASIATVAVATAMTGWSMRVMVTSPLGVTAYDETVQADALTRIVLATGVLTSSVNYAASDTVTIGTKTYTFVSPIGVTEGNVLVGGSEALSIANLVAAINHAAGAGTTYVAAAQNPDVSAVAGTHTITVTARASQTAAHSNAVATTSVMHAPGDGAWGDVTLTGGVDSTALPSALGVTMAAALVADGLTSSFDNALHKLTVATIGDGIGNYKLSVEFFPPSENDPTEVVGVRVKTNRIGIPGFVGAIVDGGVAGAVLTVVIAADTYAIPSIAGVLGFSV